MQINQWPSIFRRDEFSFKTLKQQLTPTEISAVKADYKAVWNEWKQANLAVAENFDLPKPKIESWTNGWKIRDHFWTAYRLGNVNPCLAVLLNARQLQVYLMYQNYRSETRTVSPATYQRALQRELPAWSESVDQHAYAVWANTDDELANHSSLVAPFEQSDKPGLLMVGRLWYFPLDSSFDYQTAVSAALNELLPLYKAVIN